MSDIIPQKLCNKCQKEFPATREYFVTGKLHKDGLRPLCKKCRRLTRKDRKTPPVPDGCKRCSKCKRDLPATREYFGYRSRTKDHLYEYCHECTKAMGEEQKAAPPLPDKPKVMICSKCGIEKPFTSEFFYKNSRAAYKLSRMCQDCQNEHGKIYSKEHAQEISERMKKYQQTYKQYLTEPYKKWKEANRERRQEQGRQRRLADPERFKANKRRYRQTEHGKLKSRVASRNRKMRIKGLEGFYTVDDIQNLYEKQQGQCYWCHKDLNNEYHVDHLIPITINGSTNWPENLVLACPFCNQSRGNKTVEEWLPYLEKFILSRKEKDA